MKVKKCKCGFTYSDENPSLTNIKQHENSKAHTNKRKKMNQLSVKSHFKRSAPQPAIHIASSSEEYDETDNDYAMSAVSAVSTVSAVSAVSEEPCRGYKNQTWVQPFAENYPWGRHSRPSLWITTTEGFFFSTRCNGFKSTDMPSCTPCQNLKYSTELNKIQLNSCSVGNGQGHAHSTRTMAQLKESLKVAISKNKLASIEMY